MWNLKRRKKKKTVFLATSLTTKVQCLCVCVRAQVWLWNVSVYASVLWAFPVLMQSSRERKSQTEKVCVEAECQGRSGCLYFFIFWFFFSHLGCVPGSVDCGVQHVVDWVSSDRPATWPEACSKRGCGKGRGPPHRRDKKQTRLIVKKESDYFFNWETTDWVQGYF